VAAHEVGAVGALLMGPDGTFITGSDLLMDGGVTASYFYAFTANLPHGDRHRTLQEITAAEMRFGSTVLDVPVLAGAILTRRELRNSRIMLL
jgi:hypothetical protein